MAHASFALPTRTVTGHHHAFQDAEVIEPDFDDAEDELFFFAAHCPQQDEREAA